MNDKPGLFRLPTLETNFNARGVSRSKITLRRDIAMKAVAEDPVALHVRNLVYAYVKRRHSALPISVAKVVRMTRRDMPDLMLSDSALAAIVGAEAVKAGHSVHFDSKGQWPEFRLDAAH